MEQESRPRTDEQFVNYLPAMPNLPGETSRMERVLTRLFRRRGSFIRRQ